MDKMFDYFVGAGQDNENDENAGKDTAGRAKALALTAGGITFGVQKLLGTSEDARTVGSNDPRKDFKFSDI